MSDLLPELSDWRAAYRRNLIQRIGDYAEFIKKLEEDDIFDARLFRGFRIRTFTQEDWASFAGVSQGTIGNWERGVTYPNRAYRKQVLKAAKSVLEMQRHRIDVLSNQLGIEVRIDPISTQSELDSSILRASLTDFDYDEEQGKIIAIPFASDERYGDESGLIEDKNNLLHSLGEQAEIIISGLERGANTETARLCEYFEKYKKFSTEVPPNPRLLHRIGDTIAKRTASDDVRMAVNDWDDQAIEGFNSDHLELMRLYYREALAKAQLVEAEELDKGAEETKYDVFYKVADLIDSAKSEDGMEIFDKDISTLLRDIGREVRDLDEAEAFSYDDKRRSALRRRRREAIKNGSIFVGRVLFFSSLFVVMSPASLATAGSVASILGLVEAMAPGSILSIYEKLRIALPILPRLGRN
tara:strand:+ start:70 stop:1308 length:1239 start_codon:yes stop_codon:yes gene_type:complete